MHPHRAEWGAGASAGRHRAAALVLVLHAWLLLAWLQHTGRIKVSTHAPAARTTLSWVLPAAPPATTAPPLANASPQQPRTAPAAQPAVPREQPRRPAEPTTRPITPAPSTTLSLLPAASAPEAPAPSSTPMGALLRNEATRQALRQTAQQPLLAERAEAATGVAIRRQDTGLAEGVQESAHTDCLKGDGTGKGMGLFALPALAYKAATGQCAR